MRVRLLLVVAALVGVVGLTVVPGQGAGAQAPAPAQAPTTAPLPTIVGRPDTECISANPRPDCYQSREFERSSPRHLILFAILLVALVAIAAVVVRSVRRRDRAEAVHGSPPT